MGKIAEHPIAVSISLMASVAGILTYYHQYWSSPSSTQEPAAASRQQSSDLEPASVYKPEWWIVTVIGEKPQMSGYFVDRASLRIDGSIRQAWAQLQNPVADSDRVVWFKNYSEYDCKNKSYRQIEGWKKQAMVRLLEDLKVLRNFIQYRLTQLAWRCSISYASENRGCPIRQRKKILRNP